MFNYKKIGLATFFSASILLMAACGSDTKDDTTKKEATSNLSGSLVISGSSAMQPLVASAAEQFMDENPDVTIQVNAGGSGTGLSEVSQGTVQIGNSDVFAEEKNMTGLVDHKIAVVGITAAVNAEVGITDISKEDLVKVFTGKITNWKELGGKDQKVVLVNRPDSSGTRAVFDKLALDGATPLDGVTEDSSNTVKKIISETPGAIGYLAFSYLTDDVITALSIDGVEPSAENVETGKFPVWAYQHSYTKGEAKGLTKEFLEYLESDEVQNELLEEQGYLPVTQMKVERDADGTVKNIE